ncbi:undecaprenyl-phosphate alpha-N-acetylglucosaminyl 1-phosphate transferase [Dictyobacter vulcani]|uniref:Undecaprenyl-phosphate alpha-N-acetylglucosaminyl 1-phosphate transferase n=1 Tax=Dictyobacter vulcani TaxID=2607529 RepID=A0A5J4KWX6_9CHLR|nr:MraY family glycosyltransferase [Dictyobacter vulcani]GER90971.1 undecaprenyl-phosphate alpha-N-acetylglucosaminyl 1-phosphate transferase [Dictyobacter vulcani]
MNFFQASLNFLVAQHLLLFLGGVVAFILTYVLTFGVLALCRKYNWYEPVVAHKVHKKALPRLGGLAIFGAFLLSSLLFYLPTLAMEPGKQELIWGHAISQELLIYLLFLVSSVLIVAVHAYDDVKGLKPLPKMLAQTVAVLILMGPGLQRFHGVLFFGVNNPFVPAGLTYNPALPWYQQPELTLFIREPIMSWLTIPAVLFTWFWFVGMMNAVNFMDGLDGLVAGIVTIVGLFTTIISFQLGQYTIATLAAIFTGAVAGFVPHNWNPSRMIMGDSGSQFLGLALAMLSIMGGAKFALILMILGIPILDIAWVMMNRMRRGQSPTQRDLLPQYSHKTHLHYRLLFGGLNARQICYVFYTITTIFGLSALILPRAWKFVGFGLVALIVCGLFWWSIHLQQKVAQHKQHDTQQA